MGFYIAGNFPALGGRISLWIKARPKVRLFISQNISEAVMGGYGSGRSTGRPRTGGCKAFDLARLKRKSGTGIFSWSMAGEHMGSVGYRLTHDALALFWTRDGEDREKRFALTYTPTPFGKRPWIVCGCGRRCRILYSAGRGWSCRLCNNLGYQSQVEDRGTRMRRKAGKLIRRCGFNPDEYEFPDEKPKWMRWRTFNRLGDEYDRLTSIEDVIAVQHLMRMAGMGKLGRLK